MSRPPLTIVEGRVYPLGLPNIDTDAIIAGEWLKTVTRTGLGHAAFATLRAGGGSVLDDPTFAGAPILLARDNSAVGPAANTQLGLSPIWAFA